MSPESSPTAGEIESSFGVAKITEREVPERGLQSPDGTTARRIEGFLADYIANPEPARGPAAELWRKTLARIPTHFGRLVFLASLRDGPTGRYVHPPLTEIVGGEITDRTLCHSHHQIFTEWLRFSLSEQKADLDQYLTRSQSPLDTLPYHDLPPSTAHQVERQLYLTDLETLLELLRYEHGGPFSIPEA